MSWRAYSILPGKEVGEGYFRQKEQCDQRQKSQSVQYTQEQYGQSGLWGRGDWKTGLLEKCNEFLGTSSEAGFYGYWRILLEL